MALVAFSPWPFGSYDAGWRLALYCGLALLALLWLAHVVMTRWLVLRPDAVTLCLFVLILFTAFQTVPLPESMVRLFSPTAVEYHHNLRPVVDELLPDETVEIARPTVLPISLEPSRTRDLFVELVAVFLAYAVARNLVYRKGVFRRLAWVSFVNGVLLALIALMQLFSSPRTVVFWSVETEGQVFGPFVCKNHYPFYLSLCLGLGLALLLEEWRKQHREFSAYAIPGAGIWGSLLSVLERFRSPKAVVLLGGLGLMLASVPFSLSRGGLLAVVAAGGLTAVVAWFGRDRRVGHEQGAGGGVLALILVLAAALGFGAWFGWKPVEARLETLWKGSPHAMSGDRLPLWRDLWTAAVDFPLVGAGGGTTIYLEAMTRTRTDVSSVFYRHAHNDYLEALIEGGVIRLALTLIIVVAVLWTAAGQYVRHRHRSSAPFLLGAFFGLVDVTVHSVVDFGMHIPAVALFAAVVAAFVMGTKEDLQSADNGHEGNANEPKPTPNGERVRVRRRVRIDGSVSASTRTRSRERRLPEVTPTLVGATAIAASCCAVAGSMLILREGWRNVQVERWGNAALYEAADYRNPDRMKSAGDRIEGALHNRPDDPTLWNDLAAARLQDAYDRVGRAGAAVAGPAAYVVPVDNLSPKMVDSHIIPLLRAARTARNLCPVISGPHLRLGSFADHFARAEPPAAHFDRAKKVDPADAAVYYLSGLDALNRGDREAAWADWKAALAKDAKARSRSILPPIIHAAAKPLQPDRKRLTPEELRAHVLPDDPGIWIFAANVLYPDPAIPSVERQSFLRAACDRWKAGPPPANEEDWIAWGRACEELGADTDAMEVWRRGIDTFPGSMHMRHHLARRLEADERYVEALSYLEWMVSAFPGRQDFRDRLDAARHGTKLQQELGRQ